MSRYQEDKCSKDEIFLFKQKVIDYLHLKGYKYKMIKGLRSYDGNVRIYTGEKETQIRQREGRRLVAWTENGEVKGLSGEAINALKIRGCNRLYERTKDPIIIPEYIPVYRVDDWEEEKAALDEFFVCRLKILPTDCTCTNDQYGYCKNDLCIIHGDKR